LRLAFLAPEFLPTWGGVGIYSVNLIKELSKYPDIEIHVITPKRGTDYDSSKISEFFDNKIQIHNISNANDGFFYNFSFQLSMLKNFNKLNRKYKFDLIHSANLVHMPDIYLKFKKMNIPSLTTVHTTLKSQSHVNGKSKLGKDYCEKTAVEKLTSLSYPYINLLEKIYLKRTTNFIAVSEWVKGFIANSNNDKEIKVIHNGVDSEKFHPKNKKSEEFGFLNDTNKHIIFYCGRLLALKGLKTLIYSMKEILKRHDAYFVFAGSGDTKRWEDMINLNGITEKNYKFFGYVPYEKIHHLYSKIDIFVLPSFTESFPLTILEAMSSGVPVIASNVGGIPEIIENQKDGLLFEAGNANQLAKTIINLLSNKNLRKSISLNARLKVENKFSSKDMAAETKRFYEKIIEAT